MLEAALLAPLKKPGAGLAELHETAMGLVDFILRYPRRRACLMANTALELAPHDGIIATKVRAHMQRMEAAFRHALGNAHARGEIAGDSDPDAQARSEEHTSELQSLMRISYAVFCLKKKKHTRQTT